MKKLLHIVPDDKFIDCAIDLFDSANANVENRYVCLVDSDDYSFKYIKNTSKVERVKTDSVESLWNDSNVDLFCFHTLDYSKYQYVLSIPATKKILWLSWGYDLYSQYQACPPILNISCFKPLTQNYLGYSVSWKTHIKQWLRFALHFPSRLGELYRTKKAEYQAYCVQKRVLNRVNYISTVLPSEYDMLRKNTSTKAQYFPFQYASKRAKSDLPQMVENADYLLVGNSATPTNNHLDILSILEKRGITNAIKMPMSYGDKYYADYVKGVVANSKLNIDIVTDFMERAEYISFLTHCKALVLGCMRQQALGNITLMLSQGSKVFLYKDSVNYKFLHKEGFVVFTIEDDLTNENINAPLTEQEIATNRSKMDALFGYENVRMRLDKFLSEME